MSELPRGWITSSLSQLVSKLVDGSHSPPSKQSDGLPMLSARNIADGKIYFDEFRFIKQEDFEIEDKRTNIRPGDVLLTIVGAIGRSAIIPTEMQRFTLQRSVAVVRPVNGIDAKYLKYAFDAPEFQQWMVDNAKGTAQKGIYLNKLASAHISVAPLNEQRRIVAKLDQLFTHSRRARQELEHIPKLIQRYKQAILAAAFRGDLTADWRQANPNIQPASEFLKEIKIERRSVWEKMELIRIGAKGKEISGNKWKEKYQEPEVLQDSVMPDLHNGWCWVYWEQIGLCQNGRSFPSSEYKTDGIKLLRPGNLHASGSIVWTSQNTKFLDQSWLEQYPDYLVGQNELVMNLTAQSLADDFLGRVCLSGKDEKCLLNQRIARLTPIAISPRFFFWLFKSPLFRNYVDELNTGSLIQHMFSSQIDKFIVPLPPFAEQKEIVQRIEKLFKGIEQIEQEYQKASGLCDRLEQATLSKAFRGELVPQDPGDEPAAVLLERIRAEKPASPGRKKVK